MHYCNPAVPRRSGWRSLVPGPWEVLTFLAVIGLLCLLVSQARAQEVRVRQIDQTPFAGWVRTTVDTRPPQAAGVLPDGTRYVLGRQVGADVWAVDVNVTLAAGQERTLNLATAAAAPPPSLTLPADPIGFFGGWAHVNNVPLAIVGLAQDGGSWSCHLRGRPVLGQPMFCVDAWLRWRPDEPGMATGEVLVTCSNGSVPDMTATVPAGGLHFSFGDAMTYVLGQWLDSPIVPGGTTFADGQARAVPVVLLWPRLLGDSDPAWAQVVAATRRSVSAVGIRNLWPNGNPRYPASFDPRAWSGIWQESLRRLHTWGPGTIGPNPRSGDTGAQEDQVFVRGEALLPNGLGAEQVGYAAALKLAARPCHHLEANGLQADPAQHPQCVFWSGRPHWHTGVSPDRLGKVGVFPTDLPWSGPDREHWLYNTVAAASRLHDSPVLQWELEQQARLFLFGETTTPGYSTSGPDAARSVGWAGIIVVHLWRGLEDRVLAQRVRARYEDRVRLVYAALGTRAFDIWDTRLDDARLGDGLWWLPWQQAVGAYGLDLAGEVLDIPQARQIALAGARAVMRDAWRLIDGRWQTSPVSPVAPAGAAAALQDAPIDVAKARLALGKDLFGEDWEPEASERAAAPPLFDEVFNLFGMSLAPAVVLRHDPADAQAGAVWAQLLQDADLTKETAWLPPGIVVAPPQPVVPKVGQVTKQGVTWTFAAPAPAGTFANGDPWVVGPVTVTAIAPGVKVTGGRTTGGSMLNPLPHDDGWQGYDSALYGPYQSPTGASRFHPELNVGTQLPLTITTGSLVSSTPQLTDAYPQVGQLRTAAVLTVLAAAPPADAFRPPYCGSDKAVQWTLADVDFEALADLAVAPGGPSPAAAAAPFEGSLFLDHFPNWVSRYMHPTAGLGDYYQTFTKQIGDAALIANSARSDAEKRACVVHLTQMGIDNWRVIQLGARWGVNGHCNGRKFPILFAGAVLHDDAMLAAGVAYEPFQIVGGQRRTGDAIDARQSVEVTFSEDGQTFYVRETSPGVINWGYGGYNASHVGLPEWGNFHLGQPSGDYAAWHREGQNNYRRCCSAISWSGVTLAMRAMGLQAAWHQPAFFDYVDRYLQTETTDLRGDAWQVAMWDMHRSGL